MGDSLCGTVSAMQQTVVQRKAVPGHMVNVEVLMFAESLVCRGGG